MPNHILSAFRTYMHGDGAVLLPEMQLFLFAIGTLAMDSWAANTSSEKDGGNPVFQQNYWNPAIALAGIAFSALTLGMLRARIMQSGELAGFHLTLVIDNYFVFFSALFLAATALVILLSVNSSTISAVRQGRYFALLLFACISMMLMVSAVDLVTIFLAMEAAAISAIFPGRNSRDVEQDSVSRSEIRVFQRARFGIGGVWVFTALRPERRQQYHPGCQGAWEPAQRCKSDRTQPPKLPTGLADASTFAVALA